MAPQEKYSLLSQDEFSPEPGCAEEESSMMLPHPNVYGYSDHVLVLEPSPMSDSDDSSLVSYNSTPISSPEIPPEKSPSRIARFFSSPKRVVTIAIVLAVIAVIIFLGVRGILSHAIFVIVSGVHSLGPWGAVLMVITYWVFVPFCVPITMLNLGSGFLFDFGIGTLVSSLGIMGGATISFGIARRFAPKWIHDRLDKWEYFRVLDDALQYGQTTRQHIESAAMVTLVRLPPLFPWALINYFLGITKVSFRSYFLGSYLGLIPTVAVEVYMGSLLEELSQVRSSNPEAFLITAIAVTIGVTLIITIVARRKLAKMKHAFDLRNAAVLPSVVVADTELTASLEAQAALQTVAVKC